MKDLSETIFIFNLLLHLQNIMTSVSGVVHRLVMMVVGCFWQPFDRNENCALDVDQSSRVSCCFDRSNSMSRRCLTHKQGEPLNRGI